MNELVYLACPYSHHNPAVCTTRFDAANRAAAILMAQGVLVFSPISHTHPIALAGELPTGWDYWERYDRAILACCRAVYVLTLPGWEESVGVRAEIELAKEMGLPVEYAVFRPGVVELAPTCLQCGGPALRDPDGFFCRYCHCGGGPVPVTTRIDRPVCPACGSPLAEVRCKLTCPRCLHVVESCADGGAMEAGRRAGP